MSTTRIKEKLSSIVSSQLPEFIQNDYSTFVAFIEAYYRFLEQDRGAYELIQNARSYSDIDSTTEAFVNYFLKNYAKDIPLSALANKRFLVKKIRDLYESKGSELSFKLLFNILFDKDVFVNYPHEYVLRASDGRWSQRQSLRIETLAGDRTDLTDRSLTYTLNGVVYQTPIVSTRNLTNNLTEVFFDPDFAAPNYLDSTLIYVYSGTTEIFSGIIRPTTVSALVSTPGTGFRRGQIFNINYQNGVGTLLRVANVHSNTGISEVRIIEYGYNYPSNVSTFVAILDPTKPFSTIDTPFASATRGFTSEGFILTSNTSSPARYFLEDYTSEFFTFTEILATFSSNNVSDFRVETTTNSNLARINFTLGGVAKYPGLFTAPNGFLSEPDIRLQDNALYQPFAYQTNTEKDISEFYDIVIQLVHPAGQNLFNNRLLQANIDLSSNLVISPTSNIFLEFLDVFDVVDSFQIAFPKEVDNNVFTSENVSIAYSRTDNDNVITIDTQTFSTNKGISDNTAITESVVVSFLVNREFSDNIANILSETAITLSKLINNAESVTNLTDNLSVLTQDYFAEAYIFDDYTGIISN